MIVDPADWPSQSVLIGAGILAGAAVAFGLGRRLGRSASEIFGLFGACVVAGAVFSRLLWVVSAPEAGLALLWQEPWAVADLRQGGYSSFGALAGGAALVALWWRSTPAPRDGVDRRGVVVDALVLGGLTGLAIARLGCLAAGCDFGQPTSLGWAVRHLPGSRAFAVHAHRGWIAADAAASLPVHPFGGYLAAGTLCIVMVAVVGAWTRRSRPGRIALWAASAYLVWRFAIEGLRDPATTMMLFGEVNFLQVLAVLSLGGVWWVWSRRQ